MVNDQLKILAAFDGSDLAMDAVRYISTLFPPHNTEVVLFYVETKIPESLMNPDEKRNFQITASNVRAFIAGEHRKIHQSFEQACKILQQAGFPDEAVSIKSQAKRVGIARDIIKESQEGYKALVVGRAGTSKIKDMLLGSIPTRLMGKIHGFPLIVVGGEPQRHKILVAFDESKQIGRAVRKMAVPANPDQVEVLLCHVLKSNTEKDRMETLLEELKSTLCDKGFQSNKVSCEIVTDKTSEANCIIEKAKLCGFNTIVIGRRDLNALQEFFLGRVGEKIFKLGEDITVWVWS